MKENDNIDDSVSELVGQRDVNRLTAAFSEHKIKRRDFLRGLGALGVSGILAETIATRPAAALGAARLRAAASKPTITLNFWRHNYQPETPLYGQWIKQFEALHPNIKINETTISSTDTENTKLLVAYAGGGAPDIDLVYNGYWPGYARFGFFQPIDYSVFGAGGPSEFESQWFKGSLSGWEYNGQFYGIPHDVSQYVGVISPPLFRAAGLDPVKDAPKTWEDIATIGSKLTKTKSGAIVQQGFGIPSYGSVMSLVFSGMVHQLRGRIVSADGTKALLDSPQSLKALQTLYDFENTYKISSIATTPLQGPGFNTGSTAIIADVGIWYRGFLKDTAPKIYKGGEGMQLIRWPHFASGLDIGDVLYGYAWCVNSRSPHAKEAWEFIRYMSDHDNSDIPLGDIPPKVGLLGNPSVMSNPDNALEIKQESAGGSFAAIPDQVASIILSMVSGSLLSKTPPATAAATANEQLNALLPTLSYKLAF